MQGAAEQTKRRKREEGGELEVRLPEVLISEGERDDVRGREGRADEDRRISYICLCDE